MNCEIEFLPVGNASKAGDAIVIRYGAPDAYELMLVDGGFVETGEEVVAHVRAQFGHRRLSHVVLTHADLDHASGLRHVLTELVVDNLWLHIPWDVEASILPFFADKSLTLAALKRKLQLEYEVLAELVAIAQAKGTRVLQPFAGSQIGPFQVLSPPRQMYQLLLPQFDRTPEPDEAALRAVGAWLGKSQRPNAFSSLLEKAAAAVQKFFSESWLIERLRENGRTSVTNETSVVLYGHDGTRPLLLTGDAGTVALTVAADRADAIGLPLRDFSFVQMPHHGSRRNVSPSILNRLLGPIQPQGQSPRFTAFVSAPKNDATHPRQMVVNAFLRRGAQVVATQGASKVWWGGFPPRPGYGAVAVMPFVSRVEDYD